MAVVRRHGAPNLFITMTANKNWPEVNRELRENATKQLPEHRFDIITRVFDIKSKDIQNLNHALLELESSENAKHYFTQ